MRFGISTYERSGAQPVKQTDELYLAFLDTAANGEPRDIVLSAYYLLSAATRLPTGLCAEVSQMTTPYVHSHPVTHMTRFVKTAQIAPDERAETIAHVAAYLVASEQSLVSLNDSRRFALGALDQGAHVLSYLDEEDGNGAARSAMGKSICDQLDAYVIHFIERRTEASSAEKQAGWIALAQVTAGTADFISQASIPHTQS